MTGYAKRMIFLSGAAALAAAPAQETAAKKQKNGTPLGVPFS